MQQFDHLAVEGDDAFALVLRQIERCDDLARPGDVGFGRRKGAVGRRDLIRVDQRLAVEAETCGPARIRAPVRLRL